MLERMDRFFEARLAGYDGHMLREIVEHESLILKDAGFSPVDVLKSWSNTVTLLAKRRQADRGSYILFL